MAKDLDQMKTDLRVDLSDVAETAWSVAELERAIERSVADLSRFLPRELTFDLDLTSSNIEEDVRIDLSDYIDEEDGMVGFIRVHRVEYPTDRVPQKFVSYELFGNKLTITGLEESTGQQVLSTNETMRIYYDAPHIMPEDDEPGTIPVFLENTVLLAASAYALFQRAVNFMHQADTDFTSARTQLAAAATALAKVATYLENNSDEDSKYWLTKITTDIGRLRTAILTALDACNAYLDSVATDLTAADAANGYINTYVEGTSAPASKKYLDDGDAHLNAIADGGEGQEVPHAYRQFAQSVADAIVAPLQRNRELLAQNATTRTNAAMIYAQESAQRLSNLRSYVEQANAWGQIARDFISEAEQRLGDAIQYTNVANNNLTLADRFKENAIERRNEAWSIWRDRTQYIGDFSQAPVRQMPSY